MSCDWDLICVDCNDKHGFYDANHRDGEMLILIKHADTIAGLVELFEEMRGDLEFKFGVYYGDIKPQWFKNHMGHNLMPIDEYGRLYDQCHERFICGECQTQHKCVLKSGHEGPHTKKTS